MNSRHLVIAIICYLIAAALLCLVSKWLALIYFVCALIFLVVGGILVKRSPIDPPWADEPHQFNCPKCDVTWSADGSMQTFTPKPCAPLKECPRHQPPINQDGITLADAVRVNRAARG